MKFGILKRKSASHPVIQTPCTMYHFRIFSSVFFFSFLLFCIFCVCDILVFRTNALRFFAREWSLSIGFVENLGQVLSLTSPHFLLPLFSLDSRVDLHPGFHLLGDDESVFVSAARQHLHDDVFFARIRRFCRIPPVIRRRRKRWWQLWQRRWGRRNSSPSVLRRGGRLI